MRIGIDAHFASYELRGIGKYIVQLVSRLIRGDRSNEYVVYGDSRMFPRPDGCAQVRFRNPGKLPYPVWEQSVLPWWVWQDQIDLLHCPANTAPLVLPSRTRLIVTVHDVMYLLPIDALSTSRIFRQRLGRFYRRTVVPRSARRADRIIAVSEFSKRQIAERLRVPPERILTIHEGIDSRFECMAGESACGTDAGIRERLDAPFILILGAGDPRKNTLAVIRVYAARWRELPSQEKLVIVGLGDWRASPAYQLAVELGIEERVVFAGYVSEQLLAWLYSSARCLLYPTLYEGFGFPVLEAMACGTPVITSECTSIPEIAGDAAILVDPASEKSIGDALVMLLQDERLRQVLISRGRERVSKFSWENTAEKTLGVYAGVNERVCGLAAAAGEGLT